jgi:syntaxin 5
VAKRTSVFDDPTKDIQDLTSIIKKDIGALSAAVADLQHLCDSQNESGNISRDTTSHSTTVIDNLKNRLMSTTNEFKDVLTMRTEVRLCYFSLGSLYIFSSTEIFTINTNKAPMVLLLGK